MFFLLLALAFAAAPLGAAELLAPRPPKALPKLSLAELMRLPIPTVTAASKYEQRASDAPASVTVVTTNEITRYGYRTLADLLRSVPGFYVSGNGNYSFLGTRGINQGDYNNRILLLVDGHRVNNSFSGGAYLGTEFLLDVDLIDRVEIIRGPGSSLYGNNAFFGVINVVTRRGSQMGGVGVEASAEVAGDDTYKGRLTYGHRFTNGLEFLLSGTLYDSYGAEPRRVDEDVFGSFFGSVSLSDFTIEGAFHKRRKGVPEPPFPGTVPHDPQNRTTDERSYVHLKFEHQFPDVVDVAAQVYYDHHAYEGDQIYGFAPQPLLRQEQTGEWWGGELQLIKRLGEGRHTLTAGAEYRDDFNQKFRNHYLLPGAAVFTQERTTRNYGVYFQGDFGLLDRTNLHFVGGVRYEKYEPHDPTANPRLALIYSPTPPTVFKAIYGTAFRAPNFIELGAQGLGQSLEPETITTYELAYEQDLGKRLRSSLAGFYNQIDDLISYQPDPGGGFSYRNVKGAEAKGIEAALEAGFTNGLLGRVSYSFQETRDRRTGQTLPNSPQHLGQFNLSVPLWQEKVFAGVEFQVASQRRTLGGATADGFGVVNFTLFSRNLVKGLEVSASVYNVLDNRYLDPSTPFHRLDTLEQPGRSFRVKLTYRF